MTPWKVISGDSSSSALAAADDSASVGMRSRRNNSTGTTRTGSCFRPELGERTSAGRARAAGRLLPAAGAHGTGLHGPGIDARGASFPGVSMYVQLGRGRDYTFSATSAGSDNVDTFAEVLCDDSKYKYTYKGKCRKMEKLVRNLAWAPNAIDKTPAGKAKLKVYRTVHGLVTHYGTVNGKKSRVRHRPYHLPARGRFHHGFRRFNEPDRMSSPKKFQQSASKIQFTFNWAFQNAKHTAYYLSGAYPNARRAPPGLPSTRDRQVRLARLRSEELRWTCWPRTAPADQEPSRDGLVEQQTSQGLVCLRSAVGLRAVLPLQPHRGEVADCRERRKESHACAGRAGHGESATQDIRAAKVLPTVFEAMGGF